MITQIISTALHIFWSKHLTIDLKFGIIGAATASCITFSTNFLAILIYTTVVNKTHRKIWKIDKNAFREWGPYLRLGIPGTLMIMLDMWCYEIINLESGYLGIEATAAQIILNNIQQLCN